MNKCVLFAVSLLNLTACAGQQSIETSGLTRAQLADVQISLVNDQGRCSLISSAEPARALDMKWPCRFSEDRKQKVRVEHFRQAEVIMVERSEPLAVPSTDCETDLQAIRQFRGRLEVAPVTRVAACGPGYWDQKTLVWQFDW